MDLKLARLEIRMFQIVLWFYENFSLGSHTFYDWALDILSNADFIPFFHA